MAIEEGVKCPNCNRAVIPRLWFNDKTLITFRTVQHICPVCGSIMYKTGGGVNWIATIILLVTFSLCALFLLVALRVSH
jgi:predicted RNA-binding Zn-ribbon protein involved in translation (DUF1610 family)